ncbi:MAG: nucleoside triphosphate pyrophosphohydrolase [Lentisphaerae bacterium]|nr:nucleoside triphosphate pyrophosphohydrolase [Lentisphaerota bacterium]
MSGNRHQLNESLHRLLDVVARLRGPNGCPWDREQTLESLKQYLIEESYETIDAIDSHNIEEHKEELGDVLLQIVLQSQIRSEQNEFTFADVADAVTDKLIRRHPHVFGGIKAADSAEVLANWEAIKSKETNSGRRPIFDGIPRHLPSLQKAQRIQSRASSVGFDWTQVKDVIGKVDEELNELKEAMEQCDKQEIHDEIGDLLFAVVNLSRFFGIQAEEALNSTINRFMRRFYAVEKSLESEGKTISECTLEEMNKRWNTVKESLRSSSQQRE